MVYKVSSDINCNKRRQKSFVSFFNPQNVFVCSMLCPWGYNEKVWYKVVNLAHHDKSEEPTPVE